MKYATNLLVLVWIGTLLVSCNEPVRSKLTLLGSQIPTDSALIFGPGIVSTDNFEFAITFSTSMDEMFFTRRKPDGDNMIYTMKRIEGKWSEPEPAFFTTDAGWDFEPHINPDGNLLFFGSVRPHPDTLKPRSMYQWYSEKIDGQWNSPKPLESPFADRFTMYPTSSATGNLYFTSSEAEAKPEDGGIYLAVNDGGQYKSVQKLGKEINFAGKWIAHSYIAPDESYMIFDGERPSGFGDCDLYISFNQDGHWTESYNLGSAVNTEKCEMCASVSPDGKYLFFHRGDDDNGDIYWIDFTMIRREFENRARKDDMPN